MLKNICEVKNKSWWITCRRSMATSRFLVATVIITIRSDEERGITFPAPWTPDDPTFRITIPEEGPFGAEHVIRQLTASDPQSSDPVRSFSEVPGSDPLNYFSVRHDTGEYRWLPRGISQSRYDHDSKTTIGDSIATVVALSRYYRDSIDALVVGAVKWPCLHRVWSIMLVVLTLYFNVTSHTLHAARFLSIISPLFQFNEAEMLPYGGFPVHILSLTISNSSSIL